MRIVGRMTLDRNPANYFAETEQVAFCTAHVVGGIDFTDDPLLQARNFSYLDTQLTRLGGPNFNQLPINHSRSEVNTNERDGFGQQVIHAGLAAYSPNSLGGGCPFQVGAAGGQHVPRDVRGTVVRERPASFDDHYIQATLFWNSVSATEREHIVAAFCFEVGKCVHPEVREQMLTDLANADTDLCRLVAANLGMSAPKGSPDRSAGASPALSQLPVGNRPWVKHRSRHTLIGEGVRPASETAPCLIRRRVLGCDAALPTRRHVAAHYPARVASGTCHESRAAADGVHMVVDLARADRTARPPDRPTARHADADAETTRT